MSEISKPTSSQEAITMMLEQHAPTRELIWTMETGFQLDQALAALENPNRPSDDVLSAMGLAELAYRILLGEVAEDEWPTNSDAECICPPDLLARGGHKGGCPVHGL